MPQPPWLPAAALLLWGALGGLWPAGAALAAIWLAATPQRLRLPLGDREQVRLVDLTTLALLLLGGFSVLRQGAPAGIFTLVGWLPAALLPLALAERLGSQPLRLRHLAYSLRRSALPEADLPVALAPPYLAAILLACAVRATPGDPVATAALALFLLAWLFAAHPRPWRPRALPFLAAALLAAAGGLLVARTLEQAHGAMDEWAFDLLAGGASDPYRSQTRIGALGRLKLSERILWRVEPLAPLPRPLRLRDGVYSYFDGSTWVAQRDSFQPLAATPATPAQLRLHGETQAGKAMLPLPPGGIPVAPGATLERNGLGVVRLSEGPGLLALPVAGAPAGEPWQLPPGPADLALPRVYDGLLAQLPALAALADRGEPERLAGLIAFFEPFRYTLWLGDGGQGPRGLHRFLTADRAGHCEYFASATVLLARGLGLPARYVTGFVMEEYSDLEGRYLIRNRHAHAWAELFVEGRWVEVDTTPADWLTEEEQRAPLWQPLLDLLSFGWRAFAEWREGLADAGSGAATPAGALLLLLFGGLLARRLRVQRRSAPRPAAPASQPEPPDPEGRALLMLERELAALGLPRHPAEPPRAWVGRVAREGSSVVTPERVAALREAVEALYRSRYGGESGEV